jgi:long-chain-fatty-acid--[acyl-carrier-protein] ligase
MVPDADRRVTRSSECSLASEFAQRLSTSDNDLVVLVDGTWTRHPWPEVLARSQNVADWLLNENVSAFGLSGEPTVELIAAVVGAFLAGAAVSILPGPVRGADADRWAQATLARFTGMGVGRVLSAGVHHERLSAVGLPPVVNELNSVARLQRSTTFVVPANQASVALLQGTAGSTGTPRTVQLSPDAVLSNLSGLNARIGVTGSDIGCS